MTLKEFRTNMRVKVGEWVVKNKRAIRRAIACAIPLLFLLLTFQWLWGVATSLSGRTIVPLLGLGGIEASTLSKFLTNFIFPPVFMALLTVALILGGHFLSTRIGKALRRLLDYAEGLPGLGAVYGAGKQIGLTVDAEGDTVKGKPVVWVPSPFNGAVILGIVTNEDKDAGVSTVWVTTSPSPTNGYTPEYPSTEVEPALIVDETGSARPMTFEEFLQYIVSCGIVRPKGLISSKRIARQGQATTLEPALVPA